jgi:ABC-2 type transport system ATP-binding protein
MGAERARATSPAIETVGLTKQFDGFTAVDGVSMTVEQGEIFGFLGPNGAGKTTTIRMLLGLLAPSAGQTRVLGFDVAREAVQVRQRIGYMSQRFSLYNDLTVSENLKFFGATYGVRGKTLRRRQAAVLAMAGLEGRERELAKNLAGGWRQRLALGCAILHEPELLFLDEPTAGVDPLSRREFWDLLYRLSDEGRTILVTTHYMDEAEHCHRLGFIQNGRLVTVGSPEEIKQEMRGHVLELDCTEPGEALAALVTLDSVQEASLYGSLIHVITSDLEQAQLEIEEALTRIRSEVTSIERIAPSLEDVFIASVQGELGDDRSDREETEKEGSA